MTNRPRSPRARSVVRFAAVIAAATSLGALAQAGCGGDDEAAKAALGQGCLVNTDCDSPLVCAFQRCHNQCETTRDCPTSSPIQLCVPSDRPYRVCQLPDEKKCAYNSDCPEGQACAIDGSCRPQCVADRDCVPEQVCAVGTCAETSELVDGGLPVAVTPGPAVGQPCSYTSQCEAGLACRDGACNYECMGDVDCAPPATCSDDRRCVAPDGGVQYCVPGQLYTCTCLDGKKGYQVCNGTGTGVGPCDVCPDAGL